ncbi:hypothetical protein, partial [Adlercreutzia murintestinalis]|uniref:hypothetical protein n=1 Tax=Adlercreutzia murintestinalis TaxID=2941325 RepID=UPI00204156C0
MDEPDAIPQVFRICGLGCPGIRPEPPRNVAMDIVEEAREVSTREPVVVAFYTDDNDPLHCFIPYYSTTEHLTTRPTKIELRSWCILGFTGTVQMRSDFEEIFDNGKDERFYLDIVIDIELIDGEWKIVKTAAII